MHTDITCPPGGASDGSLIDGNATSSRARRRSRRTSRRRRPARDSRCSVRSAPGRAGPHGGNAAKRRQRLEREIHLRDRAGASVVSHPGEEPRVEVGGIDELQQRPLRIGVGDDAPAGISVPSSSATPVARPSRTRIRGHSRAGADFGAGLARRVGHRRRQRARPAPDRHAAAAGSRVSRRIEQHHRAGAGRPRALGGPEDAARRDRRQQQIVENHSATRSATAIGSQRSSRKPSVRPSARNRRPVLSSSHISPAPGPFNDGGVASSSSLMNAPSRPVAAQKSA